MLPITSEKEGCNYEGACREAVFFSGGRSLINASSYNVSHHRNTLYKYLFANIFYHESTTDIFNILTTMQ